MLGSAVVNDLVRRVRARPALVTTALLVLLAAWEILTLARVKAAAPADADWQAAAAFVSAEHRPGQDLIVFAPAWIDPVGRQWLGDKLTLDDLGRMDAASYARVWEVSVRGARAPETRSMGAAVLTRDFGPVRVSRFEQAPATVTWRAHQSGEILEVAHAPHRCLRVMGKRELRGVTLGNQLAVYAGLADVWARKENRAYARVRVLVDGHEVASASIGNDSGWLALPPVVTTPGAHDVSFEVAVDPGRGDPKQARLEVCLAAEGRNVVEERPR